MHFLLTQLQSPDSLPCRHFVLHLHTVANGKGFFLFKTPIWKSACYANEAPTCSLLLYMLELWKEIYSRLASMVTVVFQISPHVSFLSPLIKERKYWKIRKTKPLYDLFQDPRVSSGMTQDVFMILKEMQHIYCTLFLLAFTFIQLNLYQCNLFKNTSHQLRFWSPHHSFRPQNVNYIFTFRLFILPD